MEKDNVARKLTDIAENLQALMALMNFVIVGQDENKTFFVNDTLPSVLDCLENQINDIMNLSDSLVSLD